jgi:hypothetical protein
MLGEIPLGFPFKGFGAFPEGTTATKIGRSGGISNRIQPNEGIEKSFLVILYPDDCYWKFFYWGFTDKTILLPKA